MRRPRSQGAVLLFLGSTVDFGKGEMSLPCVFLERVPYHMGRLYTANLQMELKA